MVFALQGFTKEFIAMADDGIGVEYLGMIIWRENEEISLALWFLQEKGNF